MGKLRDCLPAKRPDDPLYTANIMAYELGSLTKSLVYGRHAEDPMRKKAYLKEAANELSDLITQCRLMAEEIAGETAYFEIVDLGESRFRTRMKELADGVI